MERVSRLLLLIGLSVGIYLFMSGGSSGGKSELQPIQAVPLRATLARAPEQVCDLWTPELRAQLSSRGAVIKQFKLLSGKYRHEGKVLSLLTTPDHSEFSPFFTTFTLPGDAAPGSLLQAEHLDFQLSSQTSRSCTFIYEDAVARVEKTYSIGDSPYVIALALSVENRSAEEKTYTLTASTSAYLKDEAVESKMFSMNPMTTRVECFTEQGAQVREGTTEFEPSDFEDSERFVKNQLNPGDWSEPRGNASVVAVSNAYFTNAFGVDRTPEATVRPVCQLQIEDRWNAAQFSAKSQDPNAAALYKARVRFEPRKLAPKAKESFAFHAFIGPKERKALAASGDRFDALLDLGFFSWIAKFLVAFLLAVYSIVHNWGIAIVILTITAKVLLFPLSIPSIKSMIQMRELKPEMDKIAEKFKDDASGRGLAQMELWKKHNVNPMKGCLPQLASMPVWFALYTTLQTAVELYNIPFLWFPDLSASDPYYILPFIIGGVFFAQQKVMPMQSGDPAQQKMMLYFMPGMFTVFMLFLPAGLGVYMFTNSLLGILQQRLVETHAKRTLAIKKAAGGPSA